MCLLPCLLQNMHQKGDKSMLRCIVWEWWTTTRFTVVSEDCGETSQGSKYFDYDNRIHRCWWQILETKFLLKDWDDSDSRRLRTGFRPSVHPSTFVHIFYISNGPSSEYVHEIDGLSLSIVHLHPSWTNNHGLSSVSVHEMDGPSVRLYTFVHLP